LTRKGPIPCPKRNWTGSFSRSGGLPSGDELTEVLNRTTTGVQAAVKKVLQRERLLELMRWCGRCRWLRM
jgi:hypothetical protein